MSTGVMSVEEHTIWFSINDVIRILESAPVRSDMVSKINVSQVMNRAPVAHLSIERALKFLIQKRSGEFTDHHNLHTHFRTLRHCDPDVAEYLDEAFHAATQFYGLNTNVAELKHLESLDAYLPMVGTSTQSNLCRQMKDETGYGCYADWQTAVREVRHPWLRRNMRYGCRRKIGTNWSG